VGRVGVVTVLTVLVAGIGMWILNVLQRGHVADGTNTHLAITNVLKLLGTSQPEFVAGWHVLLDANLNVVQKRPSGVLSPTTYPAHAAFPRK